LSLTVVKTIADVREKIGAVRRSGKSIGLVPTMGALHAGHARLLESARAECNLVVASIFVNPLQFAPNEDYSRYPRALAADLELSERCGVDLVFSPDVKEMYPVEQLTFTEVTKVGDNLCGAYRSGHFRGVTTVVLKLFNIVQGDRAYFGEKDMQQLAVIRRMVRDLALPIEIVGVPTVREPDGLALSSRNRYLDEAQRRAAPILYRVLTKTRELVQAGERDGAVVRRRALDLLNSETQARVQYFELVDDDMQPVSRISPGTHAATAVFFGTTRLIDNIRIC
jgi:pantoate--beta-alanine ligase